MEFDSAEPRLPLTGERTVPGIVEENYWFRRHEAAYLALRPYCVDAFVLLARDAAGVLGLDYDALTLRHVAKAYPRVHTTRANLAALPVRTSTVDVVANFQVIEHLWDQEGFLAECLRVLRPGSRLLVTTPNRITFSPGRDTPLNPFHTRELAPDEMAGLLRGAGFEVEFLAGLRHGSRLGALDAEFGGSLIGAQVDVVMSGEPWPDALRDAVASVTATDFVISDKDLDSSLDIVAVAVRP
jgi:SAM-dependent methyltransferase